MEPLEFVQRAKALAARLGRVEKIVGDDTGSNERAWLLAISVLGMSENATRVLELLASLEAESTTPDQLVGFLFELGDELGMMRYRLDHEEFFNYLARDL